MCGRVLTIHVHGSNQMCDCSIGIRSISMRTWQLLAVFLLVVLWLKNKQTNPYLVLFFFFFFFSISYALTNKLITRLKCPVFSPWKWMSGFGNLSRIRAWKNWDTLFFTRKDSSQIYPLAFCKKFPLKPSAFPQLRFQWPLITHLKIFCSLNNILKNTFPDVYMSMHMHVSDLTELNWPCWVPLQSQTHRNTLGGINTLQPGAAPFWKASLRYIAKTFVINAFFFFSPVQSTHTKRQRRS